MIKKNDLKWAGRSNHLDPTWHLTNETDDDNDGDDDKMDTLLARW